MGGLSEESRGDGVCDFGDKGAVSFCKDVTTISGEEQIGQGLPDFFSNFTGVIVLLRGLVFYINR